MERITKTAYQDEDMKVDLEFLDGVPFLHIEVYHYSKSILRKMQGVFEELKEALRFYGWKDVVAYTQNSKFVKRFPGYIVIDEVEYDGVKYEVVKWPLEQ